MKKYSTYYYYYYEKKNIIINKKTLFKAIQEINEDLTKNKEGFLVDFSTKLHK